LFLFRLHFCLKISIIPAPPMQLEERSKPPRDESDLSKNGKNSSFEGKTRFSLALLMLPKRHE